MRLQSSQSLRTQSSFFAVLLLFGALCAFAMARQSRGADRAASPPPRIARPSAQVLFCDAPGTSCSPAASFSIAKLRDLNIVVNWTHLPAGNHTEGLAVLYGSGLYQSFRKGLLAPADGSFSTSSALPVAGTWIARRSLTGTWTVQASLDGHIVATRAVTLRP